MNPDFNLRMVGIDHNKAAIEYRELFSFTKAGSAEAMKQLQTRYALEGCVLLSTCNRTELYISPSEEAGCPPPFAMLCGVKGLNAAQYGGLFIERNGEEAVQHLMEVACGLDSKIFGEDQIITQVREALLLARANHCTDIMLEKVFQTAIGAAKRVKSKIKLAEADGGAALQVLALLKEKLGNLQGVSCFMIGNGKMGQMICKTLAAHGASVKMTQRKAFHGQTPAQSTIPEGCFTVPYEERIQELAGAKVVISATRSPHYTLKMAEIDGYLSLEPSIWIDLAVPRDIEPEIGSLPQIELFDIDHLAKEENRSKHDRAAEDAKIILGEYLEELKQWNAFREVIPEIQNIVRMSVEDVSKRLDQPIGSVPLPEVEKEQIRTEIERAVEKTVGKLLFGLKDTLRNSLWKECVDAVYDAANRDTLKS
jgi:glutamyl-tRNA reductase